MKKATRSTPKLKSSGPHASLEAQLEKLTDRSAGPDGCWPFQGRVITNRGSAGTYGRLTTSHAPGAEGRTTNLYAHNAAYVVAYGPIPEGLEVAHSCDNALCCNPAHLRAASHADNCADRLRRGGGALPLAKARELDGILRITKGKIDRAKLARCFGIKRGAIESIQNGAAWRAAIEGAA